MIIEYSNAKEPRGQAKLSVAIVIASCAFFFIPTTLILLGYLASRPTGTLISPLPPGTLSQIVPTISPSPTSATIQESPIIAAPNDSTVSAENRISAIGNSNIIDKTASVSAGLTQISINDTDIQSTSQIYLSPRKEDNSVYSVKSKSDGQMIISVSQASDTVRYIDYHIVNP